MKALIYFTSIAVLAGAAHAVTRPGPHEWSTVLRIVDETGSPIPDATVWVSYDVPPSANETETGGEIRGLTDTNGMFTASHTDQSVYLGFHAQKAGHYSAAAQYFLGFEATNNSINWNPTQTLVLKRILHPIPMYAKRILKGPPVLNKPIGYDLIAGDWVAPYGKGRTSDFVFTRTNSFKSSTDYESSVTLTFSNAGDGIQEFRPTDAENGGFPFNAPETGYQGQLIRETSAQPGTASKFDFNLARRYFFRVRTVLDKNQNVKSAMYGKIYGDLMQFAYYLNPTPNDHNLEFDPQNNLFVGQNVAVP